GSVMCGPGGGRFVYELRRRFDLYCKLAPIRSESPLAGASPLGGAAARSSVDIMVVRDNVGGVYQGQWSETYDAATGRQASHSFSYSEAQVRRLVGAAARVACLRSRRLAVVLKDGGVPSITALWRDVAEEVCEPLGIEPEFINVDYAAYRMLERPDLFDTMVTPNLFGDIMADLGGVLLGSRGLCYSANFRPNGSAVYQTGHGSAHDLAGTDRANPVAQIQSMAMMLRESFGQRHAADLVERAVSAVFADGWRTADLPMGGTVVGTQGMCDLIARKVETLAAGGA
ncbi:MAG: 3-isopropylmalate dehydrogenase, partial [Phycisphaerae bacterium]|nr:3-isopropylmalate dehydrogenase [Phycisphaerae bacterium]